MQPKLRAVEARWIEHNGQPALLLHDRLALCDKGIVVPAGLTPLLPLLDGTRDLPTIQTAFQLRAGAHIPLATLESLVTQMDQTLLLDSPRFDAARAAAIAEFRAEDCRPPALAGHGYPADRVALDAILNDYVSGVDGVALTAGTDIRGVVTPHIDYQRGAPVYAKALGRARAALDQAEVVLILGTDHNSIEPWPTMTMQSYATPWGTLPTDTAVVDAVVEAIGSDRAFANELHHRREHSVELAAVWVHFFRREPNYTVVPILCGSFHSFLLEGQEPADDPVIRDAVNAIRQSIAGRRALIIAAADMAHVGPAFGDAQPYGAAERATLRQSDAAALEGLCTGEARAFLRPIVEVQDRYRVCGLSPIYLALEILGGAQGEVIDYQQCPADDAGGSLVSIAGVLLR